MENINNQINIFKTTNGEIKLEVNFKEDTVWLNRQQLSILFERDIKTIGKHIGNVFKEGELERIATVANFATVQNEGNREVKRSIEYYNLDVIISVGYRVKSKRGTQFRIWANKILKDYLVKGYAINERRLAQKTEQLTELQKVVAFQNEILRKRPLSNTEAVGLLKVIGGYSKALDLLDDYDHQRLSVEEKTVQTAYKISYAEGRNAINELGKQTHFEGLFGREKDDSFKGSLENIYQTFDGEDLYPSIEEKAAHLLYFVVKNHSFTDGNKRIAAFLFVWFLDLNHLLFDENGSKKMADETLVALTLMIAESHPNDKDMMIKVIVNLL
jgi:prophage maintenance system killer protein